MNYSWLDYIQLLWIIINMSNALTDRVYAMSIYACGDGN